MFELESDLDIERGAGVIRSSARKIEVDIERAGLAQDLEANRDTFLTFTDPESRMSMIAASTAQINGAVERGYLTAQEGVRDRQAWTENAVRGAITMMPPAEQVAMLSSENNISDLLDPDEKALLLTKALKTGKVEIAKQASQVAADEIFDLGLSISEQRKLAREIEDPTVRDATLTRLNARHQEVLQEEKEENSRDLEEVYSIVDAPDTTMDDIPSDLWADLPSKDRHAVEKYVRAGDIKTDFAVWSERNELKQSDPQAFVEIDLNKDRADLSTADLKAFSDDQNKIRDGEVDQYTLLSDLQAVKQAATSVGIDVTPKKDKKKMAELGQWQYRFEQEVNQFKKQNKGREPDGGERKEILSNMAIQTVTNRRSLWFDVKDRVFEITNIPGVPDEEIDYIVIRLQENDLASSPANIQEAWRRIQVERGVAQ